MSPSDLFPAYLRKEWVQPYALKALPVTLIWLKLCYEMCVRDYTSPLLTSEGSMPNSLLNVSRK